MRFGIPQAQHWHFYTHKPTIVASFMYAIKSVAFSSLQARLMWARSKSKSRPPDFRVTKPAKTKVNSSCSHTTLPRFLCANETLSGYLSAHRPLPKHHPSWLTDGISLARQPQVNKQHTWNFNPSLHRWNISIESNFSEGASNRAVCSQNKEEDNFYLQVYAFIKSSTASYFEFCSKQFHTALTTSASLRQWSS